MITNRAPARLTSIGPIRVATIMPPIIGRSRTPVPSGSEPPTSWKYCGMTNSSPNSAKFATVDSAVPIVKSRLENSARSTSGWAERRSHATNAASRATPARIGASTLALVQPSCPASMRP